MSGTRVIRRVVVGVVVRDVIGVVIINELLNTGCIRLTRKERIKKLKVKYYFQKKNNLKTPRGLHPEAYSHTL